jgi:hypothetical protein
MFSVTGARFPCAHTAMTELRALTPCWVIVLGQLALAQGPVHSHGPFGGAPAVFSVDLQTELGIASDRGAEGWSKRLGFRTDPPPAAFGPGRPDFRANTLLRLCAGGGIAPGAPLPDIDATSLGLDVIPVIAGGVVVTPPESWTGMVFSVRAGTQGLKGSLLRAELARPDGNNADLFGFVFAPSDCLPPDQVNVTHKVADATEIPLPLGAELDAVDVYAAMYGLGIATFVGLPSLPDYYFSVTAATVDRVPDTWWSSPLAKSGAAIFKASWTGAQWTCPTEVLSPADLGLQPCHDVDAFAYEPAIGKVVLSLAPVAGGCPGGFDPLLFVQLGGAEVDGPFPLTYPGGALISEQAGMDAETADADAICILDPQCGHRQRGLRIENAVGTLWPHQITWLHPFFGQRIEAQAWRVERSPNRYAYELYIVGGQPGALAVWLWAPTTTTTPPNPLLQIPGVLQVPFGSPFLGSPTQRLLLPVPNGVDVLLYGAAVMPAPFELRLTYPVRITG